MIRLFWIKNFSRCLLLIGVVYSSSSYSAKIYKWIDDKGNTHFTSVAPKKSNSIKVVGKTKKTIQEPLDHAIQGSWLSINDYSSGSLNISDLNIRFSDKNKLTDKRELMSGAYKLNGKVLEVIYKKHYDLIKVESVGKYYIKKATDKKLILIELGSNKIFSYVRNEKFSRFRDVLNKSASRFTGGWLSLTGGRKIQFRGSNFVIKDKIDKGGYAIYKETLKGTWKFNDPHIEMIIDRHNLTRKVGKTMKFYVIKVGEVKLKIRNENSSIENFIKEY